MSTTEWRKARKSSNGGSCVEVRRSGPAVEVRDSKDRTGPVLSFTPAEWDAFLDGARRNEFNDLISE